MVFVLYSRILCIGVYSSLNAWNSSVKLSDPGLFFVGSFFFFFFD